MDKSAKNEVAAARRHKLIYKKHNRKQKEPEKPTKKKPIDDPLPSNWSKYEIKDDSDEETNLGANFETLLDEPLSEASHFIFKNEQSWSNHVEMNSQFSKYFTLDLELLSEGVSCVPFSKQHDYDSPVLQNLDEDVSKQLKKYENFLNIKYPVKDTKITIKTEETISNSEKAVIENETIKKEVIQSKEPVKIVTKKSESNIQNSKLDEDLDGLLNLKITEDDINEVIIAEDPLMAKITVSKTLTTNTTEDLEQWLDDILDD